MKRLLLLLLLVPLAFAGWEAVTIMALVASFGLLAVVYMIGVGFSVNELQMLAKEEFFQLLMVPVLIVVLLGANGILDSISTSEALIGDSSALNMREAALEHLGSWKEEVETALNDLSGWDKTISQEASKGGQCNIQGMGYSVSACGGYSVLAMPMSMSGGIAAFAVAELTAMERLIKIADAFALSFVLPLGIMLRTFKMTRGAGGFLIALAISMYIMLPGGVVFNAMLAATFEDAAGADEYAAGGSVSIEPCVAMDVSTADDPNDISDDVAAGGLDASVNMDSNEGKAVNAYLQLRNALRGHLATMVVKATMGPVIALLMMISSLKALSMAAGSDVDVSAISRFV